MGDCLAGETKQYIRLDQTESDLDGVCDTRLG